ncbi:YqhG family protein [Shouchella lonarensis]|uniref:YqhG n=1 Tax=Shouchella lonarensis TaxID=1464122 RepID=A0A1G6GMC0_9BACI|nr:YqhG family protein [Shouchella lonarensis]SDB83117.1 protein YqhG of unknown function [Shouchella lonarensis]
MKQPEVHQYLRRYFTVNDSPILTESDAHLEVQLSIELDKALMNRPFYWHYLEKTGGVPNPMTLTVVTDQARCADDMKGEAVHFGSPRLRQIFESSKSLGAFIRLYEQTPPQGQQAQPLHPWLCLNAQISFQCDRKKDILLSLGLNLVHGQIVPDFYDKAMSKTLTPKIPDYCFTLSPLIRVESGINRIKQMIRTFAENEPNDWAVAAKKRWDDDLDLLESFYRDYDEKPESYLAEKEALKEQYEPNIRVSFINGGLLYLKQQVFS